MPPSPSKKSLHLFRQASLLILLLVIASALLNLRNLQDWLALRDYQAPPAVSQLATQDTMTAYARRVFYVNHPQIEDKATFSKACPNNGGEQTIVLGCYHSGQSGIDLLSVNDSLLNGVEQVTAAHEMLHAAYERLSSSERDKVDAMLTDYYNKDLHDQRLMDVINAYKKTEPNDVVNEMHSVFGTEVANLPQSLEGYYKQYFVNRQQIASYAARYQAEFTSRHQAVSQDDAQLAAWQSQINNLEVAIKSEYGAITSDNQRLQQERASGDLASYNAGVPGYNALVNQYNAQIGQLQNLIKRYNQLVDARNSIALQENQLNNELNANVQQIQ